MDSESWDEGEGRSSIAFWGGASRFVFICFLLLFSLHHEWEKEESRRFYYEFLRMERAGLFLF